ncbi:MAG: rubredoxin [Burkholderiales bacterium]|nr:rubredoxin [Burkholderiales bacterium]
MNISLTNNESTHKWQCIICDFIYDENKGLLEDGISPQTKFESLAEDWVCPHCSASKSDFFNMSE